MKLIRAKTGPFAERPYYDDEEIERICSQALKGVDLFPDEPSPIRIDRFLEKRFDVVPEYRDLPNGLMGYTEFSSKGVESIVVSRKLSDESDKVVQRRHSTTLAHEGGHGLLHSHLFVLRDSSLSLFSEDDGQKAKILCREEHAGTIDARGVKQYDGRWWEYQANRAMGALLLPRALALTVLKPFFQKIGNFNLSALPSNKFNLAVQTLVETFDVNPIVAKIRLNQIIAKQESAQMTF